jgi:hypothetical protein
MNVARTVGITITCDPNVTSCYILR